MGVQVLFLHFGMHGLHHHNGIIDHNTDGQHQRKQVSRLMEKPIMLIKANVPTSATGTARAQISVERQSCKNRKTMMNTSTKASISVRTTS